MASSSEEGAHENSTQSRSGVTAEDKKRSSITEDANFTRFLRFGIIDNALLMLSALAGFSLDAAIARRIGVKGYGPLIGAGLGNAFSDGVAGLPEGLPAAAGVTAGAVLPVLPALVTVAMKKPLTGPYAKFVGASSALLLAASFVMETPQQHAGNDPTARTEDR